MNALRVLLTTYYDQQASEPAIVLLHDTSHGAPLIEMLARVGDGLPARALPVCEPRVLGLDALASIFAYGAGELRILLATRTLQDRDAIVRAVELLDAVLRGLGYGAGRVALIETDDPFVLGEALRAVPVRPGPAPARYVAMGDAREITTQALTAFTPPRRRRWPRWRCRPARRSAASWWRTAARCACPASRCARPRRCATARTARRCCLSRMPACNAGCAPTPARNTSSPWNRAPALLRAEAPALCTSCGKPFGMKSSIDRVAAQLTGKHWMFSDPAVIARLGMCADCRVIAQTRSSLDPYAGPARPRTRTADDPAGQ